MDSIPLGTYITFLLTLLEIAVSGLGDRVRRLIFVGLLAGFILVSTAYTKQQIVGIHFAQRLLHEQVDSLQTRFNELNEKGTDAFASVASLNLELPALPHVAIIQKVKQCAIALKELRLERNRLHVDLESRKLELLASVGSSLYTDTVTLNFSISIMNKVAQSHYNTEPLMNRMEQNLLAILDLVKGDMSATILQEVGEVRDILGRR